MNLEELIRQAVNPPPTPWHEAETRRGLRQVLRDSRECRHSGADPAAGLDLGDPLAWTDEATRITRQAELAGLGIFIWTAKTDQAVWSPKLHDLLGHARDQVAPSTRHYLDFVHPADRHRAADLLRRAWRSTSPQEEIYRVVRPTGEIRHMHWFVEVLLGEDGNPVGTIGTGRDVTEAELNKRELDRVNKRLETVMTVVGESLADRDPHTGLFTRRRLVSELDRAVTRGSGTVLLLGLTGLTGINQTHGPDLGDQLLQRVAAALAQVTAPDHTVARVGGNEFAVLMPDHSTAAAEQVAGDLLALVNTPFLLARTVLRVRGYAGLVPYGPWSGHPESGEDLLVDADLALCDAKHHQRPLVVSRPLESAHERRRQWRERVRQAIGRDRFRLHAQPILDLRRNLVTRHEVLLRLTESNELVTPSSFLPTAERLGLIGDIDRYVIEHSVRLLAAAPPEVHLQVNLSGQSVADDGLADWLEAQLDQHRVDPTHRLTFEITETALIGNVTAARHFADRIHARHCGLALDDFGSSYASLSYLKFLPFDIVKIDGELIKDLRNDPGSAIMVQAITGMCDKLGIETIAEYVEDTRAIQRVTELGATFAQGYAIGRPTPIEALLPATGTAASADDPSSLPA